MSRSSTSSSELWTAARRAIPVWIIALVVLGVGEMGARWMLSNDASWRMWSRTSAAKHRVLTKWTQEGHAPDLLIVGDSSAAFNLVPPVLDKALGVRSFNLGTAGNYPRAFDVVMTRGLLEEMESPPKRMLVSFAGIAFDPARNGQTATVLASPLARQVQGERVWAETLYLVRLHHYLRLRREPVVNPTIFRMGGFEPYVQALERRKRQPRLAAALPKAPGFLQPTPKPPKPPTIAELEPLRRLFEWSQRRGVEVVMISPPADEPVLISEITALCLEFGVRHLDYSAARIPHHNSHLRAKDARTYTGRIAKDLGW